MKVYILLPLVDIRFCGDGLTSTAKLTDDYAEQFKTKTTFYFIQAGIIGKRSSYSERFSNHWAYTRIQPETLQLQRGAGI